MTFKKQYSQTSWGACYLFIPSGLETWEQARQQWLAHSIRGGGNNSSNDNSSSTADDGTPTAVAVPLEVDEIIDVLFSPRWRGGGGGGGDSNNPHDSLHHPPARFPAPVPLPQMVDVLVDLWEAEGLDP